MLLGVANYAAARGGVPPAPVACTVPLAGFGPIDPANGFPMYYQDSTGLALAQCLDPVCAGPAFLTTKNYFVIKEYNFSDLYVLFVGHLSDRMLSPQAFATPWSASSQLRTADVEAMQRGLTRVGLYRDKIDGKAGMQTRAALGAYQKSAGLTVDCWPSETVLRSISAAR